MTNASIVMLLRGQIKQLRLQLESGEDGYCERALLELGDEMSDFLHVLGDTIIDPNLVN